MNSTAPPRPLARRLSVALAGLVALALRAVPVAAEEVVWAPLEPPRLSSPMHAYDSLRDRDLFVTDEEVWAVSRDLIPSWSRISTSPTIGAFVVYDAQADRLWSVHTGLSGPVGYPGTIWSMDLADASPVWTQRAYTGSSPGTLTLPAVAYDPTRNRVVLFGGLGHNIDPRNDVYLLSLGGTPAWSKPTIAGTKPDLRYALSGVYDPFRDRMIVFGGHFYPFSSSSVLDEAWALSMSTLTWTFLNPRSPNPAARDRHYAVLDSVGQRMVVFGGAGTPDTWAMDLAPSVPLDSAWWSPLSLGVPIEVATGEAAWLERPTRRLLHYGRQLKALDLANAGSTWALLADSLRGPTPTPIGHVAMVDGVTPTWSIGLGEIGGVWSRPFDVDQPWRLTSGAGPGTRYGAGAVADPPGARALVFGGAATASPIGQEFADLWSYSPGTASWAELSPIGTPSVRADALVLYDSARRRVLVRGGRYTLANRTRVRADTWAYDVAANTWELLAAGSFGGRWNEAGIYDPLRDRLIAFGGRDTLSTYANVHELPASGGTWSLLPTGGVPPPAIGAAAYDAVGDRMLVFADNDSVLGVYALSLGANPTWTVVASDRGSPPRHGTDFALALPPGGQGILVHGQPGNEGWVLYVNGATTPVLASLVSSHASSERIQVIWQLSRDAGDVVAQRRRPDEGWLDLGPVLPRADGRVVIEDRDAEPGRTYEYRVSFVRQGQTSYTAPVRVLVPMADALRLEGSTQNPAVGGSLYVRFSLGIDRGARLDLIDVTGRRLISRTVGAFGPGTHVLRMDSEPLPAGLYFLQLRSGARTQTARVSLLR